MRFLPALLLSLLVLGCRDGSEDSSVELRFVTWKPTQPRVWDDAIARFEREHPDVRVAREIGPHSSTALHDRIVQKLRNGDPSMDVLLMDVVWVAELASAGWLRALDARFSLEEQAEFLPGAIRANTWEERIYGVPAFVDAGWLYYRKDLLAERGLDPPRTWPELVAQARRIVAEETGLRGFTGQYKQYEGIVCSLLELVAANGGRLIDEEKRRAALLEPATLDALRFAREEIVGGIAPRSVLTYEEPESLAPFLRGSVVFHRNWPYAWDVANDPERSRVVGRVGVAPLPRFEAGRTAAALGGWQYGISRWSRRPELAWRFVRFMTSPQMQKRFAIEASLAPSRAGLYEDADLRRESPVIAGQADAFRAARPRPVTPLYPAVSEVLQRFASTVLTDPASDLEAEARKATTAIDRILSLESPGGREG